MFLHYASSNYRIPIAHTILVILLGWSGHASAGEDIREQLREILAGPVQEFPSVAARGEWTALGEFYAARNYEPMWVDERGALARAEAFQEDISHR